MARVDYLDDPNAPVANSVVPAASAVVTDGHGRILLHRRSDNGLWALPGGAMEIGESIGVTIVREVKEETGLEVEIRYVVGLYSNPRHVVAFSNGEVRQEFSVCFACRVVGGELQRSHESYEVKWFSWKSLGGLCIHKSTWQRMVDYRSRRRGWVR